MYPAPPNARGHAPPLSGDTSSTILPYIDVARMALPPAYCLLLTTYYLLLTTYYLLRYNHRAVSESDDLLLATYCLLPTKVQPPRCKRIRRGPCKASRDGRGQYALPRPGVAPRAYAFAVGIEAGLDAEFIWCMAEGAATRGRGRGVRGIYRSSSSPSPAVSLSRSDQAVEWCFPHTSYLRFCSSSAAREAL